MSLEDKLAAVRQATAGRLSAESRRTIADTVERNRMLQLAEQSVRVGDTLPDFSLPDADGRIVTSGELLDRGPLVVAFFRGDWCPYCDVALRAVDRAWPQIRAAGASLVGILPEKPEQLRRTAASKGLGFPLLSDGEGRFSELCGVRYAVPEEHVSFYLRAGIDLGERSGSGEWWLPLPAAYVARSDGLVVEAFVDPDWSYRAEPDALVAAARSGSVAVSLRDELARRREALRNGLVEPDRRLVGQSVERNRMLQLAEHSLAVGDMLPDFALPDATGRLVGSGELLDGRPLVLAFFRGGWCPYCDAALQALEAARPRIEAAGARLVGVSPETPAELTRTATSRRLGFLLLSDADAALASLCGVGYEEAQAVKAIYRRLDIAFPARDTDEVWLLPLPVTYVVGAAGRIEWLFVDPDWSYRAEPDALVEAVAGLRRDVG